ncbi:hypothetical protein CBM2637_A30010 [Cupriavidus taiwanensis]|nr:hypothetical protein CBM2637_A30010 [Cupriavidus taiwanensis]
MATFRTLAPASLTLIPQAPRHPVTHTLQYASLGGWPFKTDFYSVVPAEAGT